MESTLQLVRYDAMCAAIAECYRIDEVKEIRDKARALEVYAQQAMNEEAEKQATEVRIRAERRAGELLRDMKDSGERASQGEKKSNLVRDEVSTLKDLGISYDQSSKWQQLAAIPDHQFESAFRDPDVKPSTNGILMSSKSDEWNTPSEIVALAEKVLGRIDLDPCCNDGTPNVPAKSVFRRSDNGLAHEWKGAVYMNPPYGDAVGAWAEKLVSEYKAGRTKQAIALVAARVDTKWFYKFSPFTICFISGRLKFGGSDNSATFPSAAIYIGPGRDKFLKVFSDVGWFPNVHA